MKNVVHFSSYNAKRRIIRTIILQIAKQRATAKNIARQDARALSQSKVELFFEQQFSQHSFSGFYTQLLKLRS